MAHVGIERFRAGHRQRHRAQGEEGDEAVMQGECEGVMRQERRQHLRRLDDLAHAQHEQHDEPEQRDRPEPAADAGGAEVLDGEQRHQHAERDRHHQRLQRRCRDLEALHGAQHRNGGRQQAIAVEQRGAGDADHQVDAAAARGDRFLPRYQRHQGQHAALAAIVGAHHHDDVFQGDDDDQRPGDQRQDAQHVVMRRAEAGEFAEALLDRVERAGADVAEDDAERRQGEGCRALAAHGLDRCRFGHFAGRVFLCRPLPTESERQPGYCAGRSPGQPHFRRFCRRRNAVSFTVVDLIFGRTRRPESSTRTRQRRFRSAARCRRRTGRGLPRSSGRY